MTDEKIKSPNIYQRILGVMEDISYIKKQDRSKNKMYSYVSHDSVTAAVRPALIKHGIVIVSNCTEIKQVGNRTEILMNYKLINVDDTSDFIEVNYPGHGCDNQDKGIGKAISYSYKYMLLKTFNLETGDDNEKDHINYQEEKISLEQAEEIAFLCSDRDDLLQKILAKCPKGQLTNLQASRFDALKSWVLKELDKTE